jgi:uncharacterized glyoxalase superfamily protein PhnB
VAAQSPELRALQIVERRDLRRHGSRGPRRRFNFTVDDPEELWVELKDRVTVVEPLFDTPYGTRKFTIADPDGNELGFVRV